jgi:hypothetical protein
MDALLVLLDIVALLFGPVLLVWGWIRWIRHRPRNWTIGPVFSFARFCLATVAYAAGITTIVLARNYENTSTLIYPTMQCGSILSLAALVSTICGVWRKSPLQWIAAALSVCALCFWLAVGIGI